jgi:hypothetical protein
MNTNQERRVQGIKRIPVEALVEVCGLREDVPAFEAESRNLSDRGIRLRTAYLPELGAPVVCRFDNAGQEVLAEGVIAWRSPQARGGEFGVRFTALNSRSAQVLGRLCRDGDTREESTSDRVDVAPAQQLPAGTRVKLHIDGLSSPMRARVQQGNARGSAATSRQHDSQICVNSSLEFLKLGKRLQLENVDAGDQSEAYIDGIDVVIDPDTGVPHLVVVLRSQDTENTPEPSIIDTRGEPSAKAQPQPQPTEAIKEDEAPAQDGVDSVADDVAAMRGTLEQSFSKVGLIVKITGTRAASLSKTLYDQSSPFVQRLVRGWSGARRRKPDGTTFSRRTSPPPSQVAGAANRALRPQAPSSARVEASAKPVPKLKRKSVLVGTGATALLLTVIALASRTGAPTVASNSSNPLARAAESAARATPDAVQPALAAPNASTLMAPVPLFGQTAMATLEPAPLIAPPGATTTSSVAEREKAAAKAASNADVASGTENASEEPSDTDKGDGSATKPEDVAPWGKGKMRDPVIYRVKLDGPGTAIQGRTFSKGFSVIIPNRKTLESPAGYAKQDKRLEKVSAANADFGVKILWRFKDEIPGYRVRLRKNTVEFLISSKGE